MAIIDRWLEQARWKIHDLSDPESTINLGKFQYFTNLKKIIGDTPNPNHDSSEGEQRGHCNSTGLLYFPTCQVRVVRFYVSCLLLLSSPPLLSSSCSTATLDAQWSLSDLNHDHPRPVFPAGPEPRPSPPSVPCRTSTTTIPAQCSLPDLNREYPRPVFPAGPQPRPSTPSVPCRTSTASIHAKRYAT